MGQADCKSACPVVFITMQRILIPAAILLIAVVLPACGSCKRTAQPYPRTEIHYSSGGGVSGMSSGYSILPDGSVTRWSGRSAVPDQETIIGRLGEEDYQALMSDIEAAGFAGLRQQETGNMTTSLRIVRDDESFTFTWPGLHLKDEEVPAAVRPLRDIVWKRILSVLESGE
jgi:hypothetical protein